MSIQEHIYRGFWIRTYPVYESTKSRLARQDWRAKIVGYYFTIWMPNARGFRKPKGISDTFPTKIIAFEFAEGCVDAIADSL